MTYYGSIGEIILVCSLIYISLIWYHIVAIEPLLKHAVSLSFALIIITATLGSIRFAGFTSIVTLHEDLSWVSKHIAMLIYSAGLASTVANTKTKTLIALVTLTGLFQIFGAITVDVTLLLCLLIYVVLSEIKKTSIFALVLIALVPTVSALPTTPDVQMGIFHLLLAGHFYLMAQAIKTQSKTPKHHQAKHH